MNHMEACGKTDTVREHVHTSTVNPIRCITKCSSLAKTEWQTIRFINHSHFRSKVKGASLRDLPIGGLKSLPHRFD